jgi:hypothetical protein
MTINISHVMHGFRISVTASHLYVVQSYYVKQEEESTYNVTLRRDRVVFLSWKSNKYYLLVCVCVRACMWVPGSVGVCLRIHACGLVNPACNAYAPYCDVIYSPSVSTIFVDIVS